VTKQNGRIRACLGPADRPHEGRNTAGYTGLGRVEQPTNEHRGRNGEVGLPS
jgi:hypothetical protein